MALTLIGTSSAWAASGGASFAAHNSHLTKRSTRARRVGGHLYPGDSVHMGDRILHQGMRGHDVRVLQDFLTRAGFATPITGYFGPVTKRNLRAFQSEHGLRANGVLTYGMDVALRDADATQAQTTTAPLPAPAAVAPGSRGQVLADGLAVAPASAPTVIKDVIAAGNQIALKPYVYGGGHGSWQSSGYDCSGSVSYALHGGGLLSSPEDSTSLESYGSRGAGQWITIWANGGHAYMYVAGLRFDTAAQGSTGGSRWTAQARDNSGFVERHPTGL